MKACWQVVTVARDVSDEVIILVTDDLNKAHRSAARARKAFSEVWVEEVFIETGPVS